MTNEEKIKHTKIMLGETDDSDETIDTYLTMASAAILNRAYPYDETVTEIPPKYEFLQCKIAVYLLNKRGAEGETSHSENGISRTYGGAEIPSAMLNEIVPFVGGIK